MRILDIFKKSKGNIMVTILICVTAVAVLFMTETGEEIYKLFAFCYPAEHIWQYISGLFVHGVPGAGISFSSLHLAFNLMMVILFGSLIGKVLGDNRLSKIVLSAWTIQSVTFFVIGCITVPANEHGYGAGISGVGYTLLTVGTYILFRLFKENKKLFFKQILTYVYLNDILIMLIMFNPFIAGVSSFVLHLTGALMGVVIVLITRKRINVNLEKIHNGEELEIKSSKLNLLWIALPVAYLIIFLTFK